MRPMQVSFSINSAGVPEETFDPVVCKAVCWFLNNSAWVRNATGGN